MVKKMLFGVLLLLFFGCNITNTNVTDNNQNISSSISSSVTVKVQDKDLYALTSTSLLKYSSDYRDVIFYSAEGYPGRIVAMHYKSNDGASEKSVVNNFKYEMKLKENWAPKDIVIIDSTKGYLCSNTHDEIAIINPENGTIVSYLDISQYANDSVSTNATHMLTVDNYLYVACQMRKKNGIESTEGTLVLKVDIQTDKMVDTMRCDYSYVTDMDYSNGALFITNSGSVFKLDGAVEKIDLKSKVKTILITGESLGRDLIEIAIDENEHAIYGALQHKGLEPGLIKYSMADFSVLSDFNVLEAVSLTFDNISKILYFGNTGGVFKAEPQVVRHSSSEKFTESYTVSLPPTSIAVIGF